MDITRTIPADESPRWLTRLFDGTWRTATFPLLGVPRRCRSGDSLFLIHRGEVVSRCEILEIRRVRETAVVGSRGTKRVRALCKVVVRCPGERPVSTVRRSGHQGIRYVRLPGWGHRRATRTRGVRGCGERVR
jgi:hypothetical protein